MIQRSTFISSSVITAFTLLTYPTVSPTFAADEGTTASASGENSNLGLVARTIEACPKSIQGTPNNCVCTSNVKQMDTYSPPWTFEASPKEAFARIKGLMASDPTYTVVEIDVDTLYLKADVQRNALIQDTLEFLIKGDERVVLYKSSEKGNNGSETGVVSDFGANRKRMEALRKKGGIFDIMGSRLGSADSYEGGAGGEANSFFGQLKSFYGYQSGEGFEDVLAE